MKYIYKNVIWLLCMNSIWILFLFLNARVWKILMKRRRNKRYCERNQ